MLSHQAHGGEAVATLGVAVSVGLCLAFWARKGDLERRARQAAWAFLAVFATVTLVRTVAAVRIWGLDIELFVPMHLCDWSMFALLVAAFRPGRGRSGAFEVGYYFTLGSLAHDLFTPGLAADAPLGVRAGFFGFHGLRLTVLLFLLFGRGCRPGSGSVWRAWGWGNVWLVSALATNVVLGTNYGYLARQPAPGSMVDFLWPWPLYLVQFEALALLTFWALYVPFVRRGACGEPEGGARGSEREVSVR